MADKDAIKTDAVDDSKIEAPSPSIPVPPPAADAIKTEPNMAGSLITESAAEAAPTSTTPNTGAPNQPVVVSDNDVSSNQSAQPNEKLAEEIEILTGEIQALETKIERLTNGATSSQGDAQPDVAPIFSTATPASSVPSSVGADVAPISAPTNAASSSSKPFETNSQSDSTKNMPPSDMEKDFVTKPQPMTQSVPINTSPSISPTVSDLSPKPSADAAEEQMVPEAKESSGGGSGLEVIAEVVAVFGVVIFIILAISPFFREILGEDTYLAVQQIGWLTALGTLGLGLLLLLFIKGKGLFKFLLFFLLLITAVLFLAMNGNSLISPISGYIDPLLDFYR